MNYYTIFFFAIFDDRESETNTPHNWTGSFHRHIFLIWLCLLQKLSDVMSTCLPPLQGRRPQGLMTDSTFSYSDFTPVKSRKKRKDKHHIRLPPSPSLLLARLRDQIRREEWFTECSRRCPLKKKIPHHLLGSKKDRASSHIRKRLEFVFYWEANCSLPWTR